ncbi:MAG: glycosyltransferase family 4 protein [Mucilaginibacter sp.]|uniref:glycosyltransferase family 4 protein n=1 Tax=Mucilaginibacter sp. TaxID=1882438 RepID=UPI0034E5F99F
MRLAIITTHPIQYFAPVFQLLHKQKKLKIKVFYTLGETAQIQHDPGFGKIINWDIPLLQGYEYQFLKNTAKKPGSRNFWGIKNPDLTSEIEAWKADAILVYGWSYYSHLKVLHYFKGKISVFFRGDSTLLNQKKGVKNSIKNIFLNWVYQHVNHAFFVGTNNKAYFKKLGLKENQLTFAPHAIDNDRFSKGFLAEAEAIRTKLGIKKNKILLLFAGKFEPVKNAMLLLKAFEKLDQQNTHLLFVGNGPLEKELKAKKTVLKTASRIHFLDFQNQLAMPLIYQSCDLFCMPSNSETWGLAINEAMACGKAVLVSDKVGCAVDLVFERKNGAVFQAGNMLDLTEKLGQLCNQALLKAYGAASAQIIKDWNFNVAVKTMQEKLLNYV